MQIDTASAIAVAAIQASITFIALAIDFSPMSRRASSSPTVSTIYQRRSDPPRNLQSTETTLHLVVSARGEHAVAKLGEGDFADGNLIGKSAQCSLLLARNEYEVSKTACTATAQSA